MEFLVFLDGLFSFYLLLFEFYGDQTYGTLFPLVVGWLYTPVDLVLQLEFENMAHVRIHEYLGILWRVFVLFSLFPHDGDKSPGIEPDTRFYLIEDGDKTKEGEEAEKFLSFTNKSQRQTKQWPI